MEPARNLHGNYKRTINAAEENWDNLRQCRLSGLNVEVLSPNYLADQFGRHLHHFCTTSYLGLDYHPDLLDGAIDAIRRSGTLRIANSRNRSKLALLDDYESSLSALFQAHCLATLSCSAASAGILPLLASGAFTGNDAPTLAFDRFAHYSMSHLKAACADETEVLTVPHNDMNRLEDLCRQRKRVAYVADGFYSMGGTADLASLMDLQEKYGLFLYLDDSHAVSTVGLDGWGHVRPVIDPLGDRTIIVASLGKAFGVGGGLAMLGSNQQKRLIHRYGGPTNWSQSPNVATIGAGLACVDLHRTGALPERQRQLQKNLGLFDSLISSEYSGSSSPIRLIRVADAMIASHTCAVLADKGFLTSAVFFPVVPKNQTAVRITIRADMEPKVIRRFCALLSALLKRPNHGLQ